MLQRPKQQDPEIIADAHRLASGGAGRETVLVFLRDKGFDKIDSIKVIRVIYRMSMSEAKELVDYSAAWSDRFDSDIRLRETAWKALRDLAASGDMPKITIEDDPEAPRSTDPKH